jgi:hypothetical protein
MTVEKLVWMREARRAVLIGQEVTGEAALL